MWAMGDKWHLVSGWKSKWLNKWIGVIQVDQWKVDMWHESTLPFDPSWTKRWGREKKERKIEKRKKEESREIGSTFSLDFWVIGSSSSGGARGKVFPHKESFTTRSKLRSFNKLREVEVFSYMV